MHENCSAWESVEVVQYNEGHILIKSNILTFQNARHRSLNGFPFVSMLLSIFSILPLDPGYHQV